MSGGKCKGCGCAAQPGDPGGAGDGPPLPEGALYVYTQSVIVPKLGNEQSVFSLPPAAAVDVFIHYRDPTSAQTTDPTDGNTRFSIYATQRLLSYQVDNNLAVNVTATDARILAVRDLPVDRYELKVDGLLRTDGNVGYYDVVVIGWGKEPTAIGPLPLTEWIDGAAVPPAGRNVGLATMGVSPTDVIKLIRAGNALNHSVAAGSGDLNSMPVSVYLAAPAVRADFEAGPLLSDPNGNLKVVVSSGGSTPATTRFVSAAYEASHARAGAATLRSAFASSKAAAAGFLFIFDAAALPANGTVPDFPPVPIPAGPAFVSVDLQEGRPMTNGIVVAFSSTQATLTLSTADCWFEGHF